MLSRLALALAGLSVIAAAPVYEPKTVETTSGKVKGHIAKWPAGSAVSEYLGIPYAVPPLGQLRFAAPKAYRGNGTVLPGDKYVSGLICDPTD
jgi:hypothetical protein